MNPSTNEPAPAPPAGKPAPAQDGKPREIPREQLDHQKPADPDPDDPASP
jgi:hypothetical protein